MASDFSKIMQSLDYPMLIVTASSGDHLAGCLVGFATQTSIDPERFLVCISEKNHTHDVAMEAEALAVHIVPEDRLDLAETFGSQTDDEPGNKLDEVRWSEGPGGTPILADCGDWFAGPVLERHAFGDHTGFLVEPARANHSGDLHALGFAVAQQLPPGKTP